jgi:hypothetical protein
VSDRCPKTCPQPPLPAGLPVDVAEHHPRHKHLLKPGARCELDEGHEGKHRNGLLCWYDPPLLIVGGKPFVPTDDWEPDWEPAA